MTKSKKHPFLSSFLSVSLVPLLILAFAPYCFANLHLRINAGGEAVKAGDGTVWESDAKYHKGGKTFKFARSKNLADVQEPAPQAVYETVRHGDHAYDFRNVPDGHYLVRIHFVDGFPSTARSMDYHAEGKLVLNDVSPYEAADHQVDHVVVREFPIRVRDGDGLRLTCMKDRGNDVFHAAIEIIAHEPPPIAASAGGGDDSEPSDTAPELLELTGGKPMRLVWVQHENPNDRMAALSKEARIMGFDTRDGRGRRKITEGMGSYQKPLLSFDGSTIVFSNARDGFVYSIDWEGGDPRQLGPGILGDVWIDPATAVEWIYVRTVQENGRATVVRRQLQKPEVEEVVWKNVPYDRHIPWIQLSADGTRAAEAFPWPKCGIADITSSAREWELMGNGCWPGLAPDNSYRFFIFEGNHTCLSMFDPGSRNARTVPLNTAPETRGQKVYHPRWSNDVRLLTVTGPQMSLESELYVGSFDDQFDHIDRWVRVTYNESCDYYGDAWIEPGPDALKESLTSSPLRATPVSIDNGEPVLPQDGMVFQWLDDQHKNEVTLPGTDAPETCEGLLHGEAVFDRHFALDLANGWFQVTRPTGPLFRHFKDKHEITLAAVVTPATLKQDGPARIVTDSSGPIIRNFTLGQSGERLAFRLRTTEEDPNASRAEVTFGKLKANESHSVIIRYTDGHLVASINGETVLETSSLTGGFSSWAPHHFLFGDEWGGGRDWRGQLSGVILYNRYLSDEEVDLVEQAAQARLADRSSAARLDVSARLLESTATPDPQDLGSYRRGLIENLYEIVEVHSGKAPSERVIVSEWAIKDGKPLDNLPKVGDTVRLVLEPEAEHPELKSEWRKTELQDFTSPVYHRVGPDPRPDNPATSPLAPAP